MASCKIRDKVPIFSYVSIIDQCDERLEHFPILNKYYYFSLRGCNVE